MRVALNLATGQLLALLTPPRSPSAMIFTEVYKNPWFNPAVQVNPRLSPPSLRWVDDPFDDPALGRFTVYTDSTAGNISIAGGQFTITNPLVAQYSTFVTEGNPIDMPQVFVAIDVVSRAGGAPAYEHYHIGIVLNGNNVISALWNRVALQAQIYTRIAGVNNFDATVATAGWALPLTMALQIVGNWAVWWVYRAGAWAVVTSFDLTPRVNVKGLPLSTWHGMFGLASNNAAISAVFDNFRVGRFGGVGVGDFVALTNEDGTPLSAGNTYQVLATMNSPVGGPNAASQGLFTANLDTKTFTQDALIMVSRGGNIQNDQGANMIVYPSGDQMLSISSWGDFPAQTRILNKLELAATQNLLVGSHVVAGMATLNLTDLPPQGDYDPSLVRLGGTWYMAYTASPAAANTFYPVLDSSPDLINWANVGKDVAAARYEGPRITPIAGYWYVMAGGQTNMRVYNMSMALNCVLNLESPGTGITAAHPMVMRGQRLYWCLTFDDTTWPVVGGAADSWGWVRLFASPLD